MRSIISRRRVFELVAAGCVLFVVLTALAMLVYPGGTITDPTTRGYSFFTNFFSDLGRTETRGGHPNLLAAALFFIALTGAGSALVTFFLAFAGFFTRTRFDRVLAWLGTFAGVIAGVCFIGVAFTPANLASALHNQFVFAAFEAFTAATIVYFILLLRAPDYPRRYAAVFGVFAVLLALYLGLLFGGPSPRTPEGLLIQATGQKIIVYASIISVLIQSLGARRRVA